MAPLLEVDNLRVVYDGPRGPVAAADGVSFRVDPGETYALVGESGCGKTATALSILRLVEPGRISGGRIVFDGRDLVTLPERELRKVRGAGVGMVFQEASAALNPVLRIGAQVGESLRIHRGLSRREAVTEAVRLLRMVSLPDPEANVRAYPHELSGGMKQRVMLAIALSCAPKLLVADEPTTALDVTIQAQILALLRRLRSEMGLTVLAITHDLGVVAENADRVGVMYAGRIVEEAPVGDLFRDPRHPYTRGLLRSIPGAATAGPGGDGGRPRLPTLPGSVPDPTSLPAGCRFHPRCSEAFEPCSRSEPPDFPLGESRRSACFLDDPSLRGPRSAAPAGR